MINSDKMKYEMPEQHPETRIENFEEVALGYSEIMAINEAMRCVQCRTKPCVTGCPVRNNIPAFVNAVSRGKFEDAYDILSETTALPAICGRVCPHEKQCEGKCTLGKKGQPLAIGNLERFVADWHREHADDMIADIKSNGHRVAVIGSGPAGISCAGALAGKGYEVTIFDSFERAGGVLTYGIPEFRLPREIVDNEILKLERKGVKIEKNTSIGKDKTIDDIFDSGFEAVFLGTGAGVPVSMSIEGENLKGVYSAGSYLSRVKMMNAYGDEKDSVRDAKNIVVVGGGNVAMDAARSALRMGAEKVSVVYRRSRDEMPAFSAEICEAEAEGVEFILLNNPIKVIGDGEGRVTGVECIGMALGDPDESGRRSPVPVEGSNFIIDADAVIMAIGSRTDKSIVRTTEGLKENKSGGILTDEKAATSKRAIFAGGDAVTGPATVVKAMAAGRTAAESIDRYFA